MSIYAYHGIRVPTTRIELWQERREELYASQNAERVLARFDVAGDPEPQERPEAGEAEEADPVTAADRWEWSGLAWCELDTSRFHLMTMEEIERATRPVEEYVDRQARKKRDEYFGETRKELIELYSKVKGE